MSNIIRLVITKGCEGCKIAENIIIKAIKQSNFKDIKLDIIDCLDVNYKQFINRYFIDDYPTIVFIKDDKVLTKYIGTVSVDKLVNEINIWFKA